MTALPRITALYVPGSRPDRFDKAVASGAQVVILDLEDAVAPADKDTARRDIEAWFTALDPAKTPVIQVRANAVGTDWFERDLRMIARLGQHAPVELRLPKVEQLTDLDEAATDLLGQVRVCALIETAIGLENAFLLAQHPAVSTIALGDSDLAGDLGSSSAGVLDWARIRLLVAARAAGLPAPMLSVYPELRDLAGLEADTVRGRSLGFVGRTAAHPSQLAPIARAFRPSQAEVDWAAEVERVLSDTANGVGVLASGEMVDAAMAATAARVRALQVAVATIAGA